MAQTKVDLLEKKIKYMDESARLDMQIARSAEGHYKRQMGNLLDTMGAITVRAAVAGVAILEARCSRRPGTGPEPE